VTTETVISTTNYSLNPNYIANSATQDVTTNHALNNSTLTPGDVVGSNVIDNWIPVTNINVGAGFQWVTYRLEVPPGASELIIGTSGGNGDVVLAATHGTLANFPDAISDDNLNGETNKEQVVIKNPSSGTWYISLRADQNVQGLTLEAGYNFGTAGVVVLHPDVAAEGLSDNAEGERVFSFNVPTGTGNFSVSLRATTVTLIFI